MVLPPHSPSTDLIRLAVESPRGTSPRGAPRTVRDTLSRVIRLPSSTANQFMMEMMGMTGLAIGQVNATLQARIDNMRQAAAEKARIDALNCAPVLKTFSCSWSTYLEANPSVKAWAENNPSLVNAEKARLRAVE